MFVDKTSVLLRNVWLDWMKWKPLWIKKKTMLLYWRSKCGWRANTLGVAPAIANFICVEFDSPQPARWQVVVTLILLQAVAWTTGIEEVSSFCSFVVKMLSASCLVHRVTFPLKLLWVGIGIGSMLRYGRWKPKSLTAEIMFKPILFTYVSTLSNLHQLNR